MRWILGAILGGAIGNTYDRIVYGYVIDFVDVDFPNWIMDRFAVFNVADAAVSVGVTVLLLLLIFQKPAPEPDKSEGSDSSYRKMRTGTTPILVRLSLLIPKGLNRRQRRHEANCWAF